MSQHKQQLGKEGEKLATQHLIAKGYSILAKNYRHGYAEIDIVAQIDKTVVFVEVKTRETDKYGQPEDFVSHSKIKKLAEGAEGYIEEYDINLDARYDIISIILNKHQTEINHFEDAFWPGLY